MSGSSTPGQRQREAYGALEQAVRALVAGDSERLKGSLDKVETLDEQERYRSVVEVLRTVSVSAADGGEAVDLDLVVIEMRNLLGAHPLLSLLEEGLSTKPGSEGSTLGDTAS
jgi:hypothetical protein